MSNLDKSLENLSIQEDDIATRHRKERKELQAKVQALKKSAGKSDKKKKKEILEEIARLEFDLEKKQNEELANTVTIEANEHDANRNDIEPTVNNMEMENGGNRISKAQKRRDKKAAEEKIRQAEYLEQEELNKTGPRAIEINTIKNILSKRGLALHPISSDGRFQWNLIHKFTKSIIDQSKIPCKLTTNRINCLLLHRKLFIQRHTQSIASNRTFRR